MGSTVDPLTGRRTWGVGDTGVYVAPSVVAAPPSRRPPAYRFLDEHRSNSGRWEMWMDSTQAHAVRRAAQQR
jgi:hypothetical protein